MLLLRRLSIVTKICSNTEGNFCRVELLSLVGPMLHPMLLPMLHPMSYPCYYFLLITERLYLPACICWYRKIL